MQQKRTGALIYRIGKWCRRIALLIAVLGVCDIGVQVLSLFTTPYYRSFPSPIFFSTLVGQVVSILLVTIGWSMLLFTAGVVIDHVFGLVPLEQADDDIEVSSIED
jgi:hypothetical protein